MAINGRTSSHYYILAHHTHTHILPLCAELDNLLFEFHDRHDRLRALMDLELQRRTLKFTSIEPKKCSSLNMNEPKRHTISFNIRNRKRNSIESGRSVYETPTAHLHTWKHRNRLVWFGLVLIFLDTEKRHLSFSNMHTLVIAKWVTLIHLVHQFWPPSTTRHHEQLKRQLLPFSTHFTFAIKLEWMQAIVLNGQCMILTFSVIEAHSQWTVFIVPQFSFEMKWNKQHFQNYFFLFNEFQCDFFDGKICTVHTVSSSVFKRHKYYKMKLRRCKY